MTNKTKNKYNVEVRNEIFKVIIKKYFFLYSLKNH